MNLTVGPLPPAVYWRRRALVLGVVLLLVILLVSMCGGTGGANKAHPGLTGSSSTSSAQSSPTPSDSSQPPILGGPGSVTGSPAGAGGSGGSAAPGGSGAAAPSAGASVDPALCTDAEMLLTPSIQEVVAGDYPYQMTLKIRNTSTRTCKRDVGAGPQELHITDTAGHVLWSSDYCQNGAGGSDVRTFGPNIETPFKLAWDGYGDGPGCAKGARIGPGTYQLVAKLATKVSAPVAFTIKAGDAVGS